MRFAPLSRGPFDGPLDERVRTVNTEHQLAGLDVTRHTLEDACRAFGMPSLRDTHDLIESDSRGAFTLAHVEWGLGDVTVAVVTRVRMDDESAEEVVAIRVSGRGMDYQTGAGLRVGDTMADAIVRYGPPSRADPSSFRLADGGYLSLVVRADQVIEIQLMSPWFAAMSSLQRDGTPESDEAVEQGDEADEA